MNRYTHRRGFSVGATQRRSGRWKSAVIVLLLAALGASLFFGLPAIRFRQEMRELYVARMVSECDNISRLVSGLSRTSGTYSYDTIANIRARVYAIDVLNQNMASLTGDNLVNADLLNRFYGLIDECNNNLITGQATGNVQSEMTTQTALLMTAISALE